MSDATKIIQVFLFYFKCKNYCNYITAFSFKMTTRTQAPSANVEASYLSICGKREKVKACSTIAQHKNPI